MFPGPVRAGAIAMAIITGHCISNFRVRNPCMRTATPVTDEPEVPTRIDNGVGRLTLNRPKAINS